MLVVLVAAGSLLGVNCNDQEDPKGVALFTSPVVDTLALSEDGTLLLVASTTSDLVDVIDTATWQVIRQIEVGLDPVSVEIRPGALEAWVSCHVSDSVLVIDLDATSDTFLQVVDTIQEIVNGVTAFDEPVGIAFKEDGSRAYVALSSTNDVAVIDAATRAILKRIHITAQEPRALVVRNGLLYVLPFESFNQTELSLCPDGGGGAQCTLDIDDFIDFVIESPNIPGADSRIVRDPQAPDRDLYVYDTNANEAQVTIVDGIGTLLYDLAVDSTGRVFIAQTEALNDANGGANENGENDLIELGNRPFLNQIGRVDCGPGGCGGPSVIELEPLPPSNPVDGDQLANPYGIEISGDDTTVVATAAMTSRLFTMDATSGHVLDILDMNAGVANDFGQQIPRSVELVSDAQGAPSMAYVHNSLEDTVSRVDVSNPSSLVHISKLAVGDDPTPDEIRRGRIAFTTAFASTTGTFSCESCHPDSNTDQLLWRIGGPCFFGDCTGHDEIRSTMPVRGLKNTLPLHWDGTLGDPFGGPDGSTGNGGNLAPNCNGNDDHTCFLQLVGASLSGVMCTQQAAGNSQACSVTGPSGSDGALSNAERDDMARFLAAVFYPPPPFRNLDDSVTSSALDGFSEFFVDAGGIGGGLGGVRTCADMDSGCHALPLGADTNSSTLGAFDAPTMRGMTDRTLQFSIGITNPEEVLSFAVDPGPQIIFGLPLSLPDAEFPWDPTEGYEEIVTYSAAFMLFAPVYNATAGNTFQMFEEASTGFSGALGRQLTLNTATAGDAASEALLADLEAADADGLVGLKGSGWLDAGAAGSTSVRLDYQAGPDHYQSSDGILVFTRQEILQRAAAGTLVVTLTGHLPKNVGKPAFPHALLSVSHTGDGVLGNPDLPLLSSNVAMNLLAIDVRSDAQVIVDGLVDPTATLTCLNGTTGASLCNPPAGAGQPNVSITLGSLPGEGLHLLQVQNPSSLISPELPICVDTANPINGSNCR